MTRAPLYSTKCAAAMLERFHREVRTARKVSHPNVCRVFDIGETAGQHFLSMEYEAAGGLRAGVRSDVYPNVEDGNRRRQV